MIARILAKLQHDKSRAVIVTPRFQSAWLWPTLKTMRRGPPYIISGIIYKDRDRERRNEVAHASLVAGQKPDGRYYISWQRVCLARLFEQEVAEHLRPPCLPTTH